MAATSNKDRHWVEPYTPFYVLRFHERDDSPHRVDHRTELTERRCFEIAQLNELMTTAEVHAALMRGKRIYSHFSYFVIE